MKKKIRYEDSTSLNGEKIGALGKPIRGESIGLPSPKETAALDTHIYRKGKLVEVRKPTSRAQITLNLPQKLVQRLQKEARRKRKTLSQIAESRLKIKHA